MRVLFIIIVLQKAATMLCNFQVVDLTVNSALILWFLMDSRFLDWSVREFAGDLNDIAQWVPTCENGGDADASPILRGCSMEPQKTV